jgi:transposase InsO family protein
VTELHTEGCRSEVNSLCELFGRSRQAYYQRTKYNYKLWAKSEILYQLVEKQREMMPRIGGRKLFKIIVASLPEEMKMGRDSFFDFLRENGLLVRKRRNRVRTTYSNHWLHKYPNLVKGFTPVRPHQLLVSDITYISTNEGFGYLNLITDAYSRKITGWALGETLESRYTVDALKMAIRGMPKGIKDVYHHSDRGVQYCSNEYVKILKKRRFKISMTEDGDPRENAIAERVNGILKDEWLNQMKPQSLGEASRQLQQIIRIYNEQRPHTSLDMKTPQYAHNQSGEFKKHWKNYYYSNGNEEKKINSFISPGEAMVKP